MPIDEESLRKKLRAYERWLASTGTPDPTRRTYVNQARRFVDYAIGGASRNRAKAPTLRSSASTDRSEFPKNPPAALRRILAQWNAAGGPEQGAVQWGKPAWLVQFPAHRAFLGSLPAELDRALLRQVCGGVPKSNVDALHGLLAVMAWGYRGLGRGRYWAGEVLADLDQKDERLVVCRAALRGGDPVGAYSVLAARPIRGLGPTFATKYLFFSQRTTNKVRALILDENVATWFAENLGVRVASGRWSSSQYARYVDRMGAWATTLGVRPDDLELAMFRGSTSKRGNFWGKR
jgi:hypothetical protein